MRAFVAITPPAEALADLTRFVEPRAEAADDWRWTPAENYHITLAFLGDVDDARAELIEQELETVAARQARFRAELRGAGAFASVLKARHLYAAVTSDGATGLAGAVRGCALRAGCQVDKASYVPHVTLARRRSPIDATHLWRILDTYAGPAWTVGSLTLFRSDLGQGRNGHPRYVVERAFPFGG